MSTRTIIEINHDQLSMLERERDCVFPQLLHALRSGEGPCWVGREFVQGDGIRILGQRHHSEPEWVQDRAHFRALTLIEIARYAQAALLQKRAGVEDLCADLRHVQHLANSTIDTLLAGSEPTPAPRHPDKSELKRLVSLVFGEGFHIRQTSQIDPRRQWVELTDDDRNRAFQSLPDMLEGFLKTWGWLHFANAIEAICREKNTSPPSWEPSFDAMCPKQERLAIQFCEDIAGRKGGHGSPPDPVRLLEMAEALYRAEREEFAMPQQPTTEAAGCR